jgi:uncharacterized protein YqjF (DUF2071 family)
VLQRWRSVSFLHWPVHPEAIARMLPFGLVPDTWDGNAWVGITPFSTTCEVLGVQSLPGPTRFAETNVRTYVRAPDGTAGIWFFSLDVANRANAVLGRALHVPYHEADNTVEQADESNGPNRYLGRRRGSPDACYDMAITPGRAAAHDAFEGFLVDRWCAYVIVSSRLIRVDVEHEPWPLHVAVADRVEETLTHAVGIVVAGEPVCHYASGVTARLSFPRLVTAREGSSARSEPEDRR